MAQSQQPSSRRQNLLCAVCREVYRSPRLLPQCHHSFCLQCLEGLARTQGRCFSCPTCRTAVRVPEGGVGRFAVNFYIPEEDLERERNQVFKPMCGTHATEELIFFCQQCDQAICLRCKLTKHDHHPTEDLADAAKRCKKLLRTARRRLQKSVQKLTKASQLSRDNHKAAKEKADNLKAQINEQYDSIVTVVTKQRDQALRDLDALTSSIDDDLSTHISTAQRHLDSLIQLQQQISHAIDSDNDAEVVVVEREVRKGEGSVEEVKKMESCLSSSTQRPSLQRDGTPVLREQDVARLFGSPVRLQLPSVAPRETATPWYKYEGVHGCREVTAIRRLSHDSMIITYGSRAPANDHEVEMNMNIYTRNVFESVQSAEKKELNNSASQILHAKTGGFAKVSLQNQPPKAAVISPTGKETEFYLEDASAPVAIDVEDDGKYLIVLSEDTSPSPPGDEGTTMKSPFLAAVHARTKTRTVRMYVPEQSNAVSRYTPPQQPFFPTDVCFYGKHFLLISDLATDSIHMVFLTDNQFQFFRYLANGSPHILRPTALCSPNTSVFIGCENGWVARAEPRFDYELVESEEEEEEMEEDEGEKEDEESIDGGSRRLQVENCSESTVSVDAT